MVMGAMANKLTAIVDGGSTYFANKVMVSDSTNPAFAFGLTPIPIDTVDQIAEISGVAVAAPRVQFLLDQDDSGSGFTSPDFVVAFKSGFDQGYETFRSEVSKGRETSLSDEGQNVVVLGSDLSRKFGAEPGDYFDIRGDSFEVIGVLQPSLTFFDTTAVIPWTAGQSLLKRTHLLSKERQSIGTELTSMVIVYPKAGADKGSLIREVETRFPQLRAVTGEDFDEQFGSTIAIFNAIILSVALISIVVGGLSVINTMTISVTERKREIGIKRAIGATRGMIMRELIIEAGFMGFVGGLTGLGLAIVVIYFSNEAGESTGTVLFRLTPWIGTLGVAFATILGAVAGILPAWNAARMDPVEAMRQG